MCVFFSTFVLLSLRLFNLIGFLCHFRPFKQCVQCKVYEEKGWYEDAYDPDYCAQSCGNGSNIEFIFIEELPTGKQFMSPKFCEVDAKCWVVNRFVSQLGRGLNRMFHLCPSVSFFNLLGISFRSVPTEVQKPFIMPFHLPADFSL